MNHHLKPARIALVLLPLMGCVPLQPASNMLGLKSEAQIIAERQALQKATDDLFGMALQSGKAIVVTTTVNLDSMTYDLNSNEGMNDFAKLQKAGVEWVNSQAPNNVLRVGNTNRAPDVGVTGSHYQTVFGRVLYQVYIVEPGHYELKNSYYESPRTVTPNLTGRETPKPSPLGHTVLKEKLNAEYDRGQEWRDAQYANKTYEQSYCTTVRVVSNECVNWQTSSYDVTEQTRAAGWANTVSERKVEALDVHSALAKPFASFDVAAGEAVLVDGFFPEVPNIDFRDEQCERIASEQVQCELDGLYLVRLPTQLKDFRNANDPSKYGYRQMSTALSGLQLRPVVLAAKPTKGQSRWGELYRVAR
ncbi:hypothetical protein SAMN05216588_106157 [Pseudomonas flavescens]|uniref:Lipoprotein n=1 Tax=Phytopseudomonas flavescens TaxID=29435 RepID=A0A1G8EC66_9GAMM|nr:hypothetical protein [Pseudomonas flavescens]SDH67474.1 hypothetical protein SAMN05216588_106157 [Pseudomonas flavescens]